MFKKLSVLFALSTLTLVGCEDKETEETVEEKAAATVEEAKPLPKKSAEEMLAEEKAKKEEAKRKAEEAKKQAEVDANPLTECCRALGQKGFKLRSPEYMAASKACGEAMTEEAPVGTALIGIKKALKGKTLPSECSE